MIFGLDYYQLISFSNLKEIPEMLALLFSLLTNRGPDKYCLFVVTGEKLGFSFFGLI